MQKNMHSPLPPHKRMEHTGVSMSMHVHVGVYINIHIHTYHIVFFSIFFYFSDALTSGPLLALEGLPGIVG